MLPFLIFQLPHQVNMVNTVAWCLVINFSLTAFFHVVLAILYYSMVFFLFANVHDFSASQWVKCVQLWLALIIYFQIWEPVGKLLNFLEGLYFVIQFISWKDMYLVYGSTQLLLSSKLVIINSSLQASCLMFLLLNIL